MKFKKKLKRVFSQWYRLHYIVFNVCLIKIKEVFVSKEALIYSELKKLKSRGLFSENISLENIKRNIEAINNIESYRRKPSLSQDSTILIYCLLDLIKPKTLLEIGSGCSTLMFGMTNSKVVSLDIDKKNQSITESNLKNLGIGRNVKLVNDSVIDYINTTNSKKRSNDKGKRRTFDVVFIDGYQKQYQEYLVAALKLKPKLIIADNVYLPVTEGIHPYLKELKRMRIQNTNIKVGKGLNIAKL